MQTMQTSTDDNSAGSIQTVEIIKQPGQTLGFYIREGNGINRWTGVFISRIAPGSVVAANGILHVGDEILSVNGVDVTRTRLDDVVVLMSIPKRLVLDIRVPRPSCGDVNCANAACSVRAPYDDLGSGPPSQPVVVLKSGFNAGSFDAVGCGGGMGGGGGGGDRSPDDVTDGRSGFTLQHHQRQSSTGGGGQRYKNRDGNFGEDSSMDNGLNYPGLTRSAGEADCIGHSTFPTSSRYGSSNGPGYASELMYMSAGGGGPGMRGQPGSGYRSSAGTTTYSTVPRSGVDYASDTDVGYHGSSRVPVGRFVMRGSSPSSRSQLPDRGGSYNGYDEPAGMVGGRGGLVNGGISGSGGQRSSSFDQYNSDSEVFGGSYGAQRTSSRAMSGSMSITHGGGCLDGGGPVDERSFSLPHVYSGYGSNDECESWNGKFESLSLAQPMNHVSRPKAPGSSSLDMRSYGGDMTASPLRNSVDSRRIDGGSSGSGLLTATAYDDYETRLNRAISPAGRAGIGGGPATAPRTVTNHRLTRKMSADSLIAYRTYQMDDGKPLNDTKDLLQAQRVGSAGVVTNSRGGIIRGGGGGAGSKPTPTAAFNSGGGQNPSSYSTMTLSRAQHIAGRGGPSGGSATNRSSSSGIAPSPFYPTNNGTSAGGSNNAVGTAASSKLRNLQLSRKPLQIQTESFRPCRPNGSQSIGSQSLMGPSVTGLLLVHVYCAHGLRSSSFRATLRDLYCVVEVDAVSRARTMVRTGAINFDWDEAFDVDIDGARRLSFLVYSWDPNVRHRLCFSGAVALQVLRESGPRQRLAVALEPKGVLYIELDFREMTAALRRTPSVCRDSVFGVSLTELVARERSTVGVPVVVQRCVEEVERRGMDHVGIYRLCGSAKRKLQLREELERNPLTADLSPDAISDINVVTSVLKDFFRELPEPLCTNSLYQMLMDALNVQISGDHEGNARLMLGILDCLPSVNQDTLTYLLDHLKRVALRSDVNKMTSLNLALCFGPSLVCPSPQSDLDLQPTEKLDKQVELLKYLLDIWPETRDLNSTVERLRSGSGSGCSSRFDAAEFRSDGAGTTTTDVRNSCGSTSTSRPGDGGFGGAGDNGSSATLERDTRLEETIAASWDNMESSPC